RSAAVRRGAVPLLLPVPHAEKARAAVLPFPPPLWGPRRAKLALEARERGSPSAVLRLALEDREAGPRVALARKSTNPISTKCTARSRCPIAPAARRANRHKRTPRHAAEVKSFSRPTRANPVPSSAPPRAQPAAHLGIGVGGRSGDSGASNSSDFG